MNPVITLAARGVKAGLKAKAQGANNKTAIAKAINASTGVKVSTIIKAIDLTVENSPILINQTKVILNKVKSKTK